MITKNLQEFCHFLKKNQPIIGIDYGEKKIGIAVSSQECTISMPLFIIKNLSLKHTLKVIDDVKSKYNACAFVIGLPLHLDGKISNQTRIVEEFACNLYKHLNIIIYLQDERLTTKAANNLLKMFNNESRLYKRQEDDAIAASMILETTLDSIKNLKNHL